MFMGLCKGLGIRNGQWTSVKDSKKRQTVLDYSAHKNHGRQRLEIKTKNNFAYHLLFRAQLRNCAGNKQNMEASGLYVAKLEHDQRMVALWPGSRRETRLQMPPIAKQQHWEYIVYRTLSMNNVERSDG